MTPKETKKKVSQKVVEDHWINPLELFSSDEFNDKNATGDYRARAVDRAIKAKVPFHNEDNCTLEMAKKLLVAICPHCGAALVPQGGGGAGCGPFMISRISFPCKKCKVEVTLYLHKGSLYLQNREG